MLRSKARSQSGNFNLHDRTIPATSSQEETRLMKDLSIIGAQFSPSLKIREIPECYYIKEEMEYLLSSLVNIIYSYYLNARFKLFMLTPLIY